MLRGTVVTGRKTPTLRQVVTAQVAYLHGKFARLPRGAEEAEIAAARAERVETADRLATYLSAMNAPEAAIIQEVRRISRVLYNEDLQKMPSAEMLAAKVKEAFKAGEARPTCAGCEAMGGFYMTGSPDEPLQGAVLGDIEWKGHGWLCVWHNGVAVWFAHRERRRRGVASIQGCPARFDYPPPREMLPRHARPSALDVFGSWDAYTDGAATTPMATWGRSFVEKATGWKIGETEEPLWQEGHPKPDPAPEGPQAWETV